MIQLDIPKEMATVSEIFRVLEKEKEHYNILYYTVSQNTLETVSPVHSFPIVKHLGSGDSPHIPGPSCSKHGQLNKLVKRSTR